MNKPTLSKMYFITFEGIDGAGKTLQARMLRDRLVMEGYEVWLTEEPTDGVIGSLLRDFIDGKLNLREETVALLFAADRLEHLKDVEEALLYRRYVISDRYLLSSLAYQGSKLPIEWVKEINKFARLPDVVILLDLPPEQAYSRTSKKGAFDRDLDRLSKIRQLYLELSQEPPWRDVTVKIDASRRPEEVHSDVMKALRDKGLV